MAKQSTYFTKGTCSQVILTEIDNGTIVSVQFVGGCSGNTKGISALVKGMEATRAIELLRGIDCNGRGTSCPDQLAKALEQALKE